MTDSAFAGCIDTVYFLPLQVALRDQGSRLERTGWGFSHLWSPKVASRGGPAPSMVSCHHSDLLREDRTSD